MPDLGGRVAVVTGANGGLGYETARVLAAHGAHVLMACRDLEKAGRAIKRIHGDDPAAELEPRILDLADLGSVRRFAEGFALDHDRLDLLVNNAGVMALPLRRTADGFEMQMGTNHFGHFALTGLLLESILAAPAARVVTVTSLMHELGHIDFDDLDCERHYHKWRAYGRSKLANLLFTHELQARLAEADASAIAVACHPGYAATDLQVAGPRMSGSPWGERMQGSPPGCSATTREPALGPPSTPRRCPAWSGASASAPGVSCSCAALRHRCGPADGRTTRSSPAGCGPCRSNAPASRSTPCPSTGRRISG